MINMNIIRKKEKPSIKEAVRKSLKRRYFFEGLFHGLGLVAIAIALFVLVFLLYSLVSKGVGAFRQTHLALDITYPEMITVKPVAYRDSKSGKIIKDAEGKYQFDFSSYPSIKNIPYTREGKNKIIFNLRKLKGDDYKHVVAAAESLYFRKLLKKSVKDMTQNSLGSKLTGVGAEVRLRHYLKKHPEALDQKATIKVPVQAEFDYWWRHGGSAAEGNLEQLDQKIAATDTTNILLLKELKNQRKRLVGRFERMIPIVSNLNQKGLFSIRFSGRIFTNLDSSEADYAGLRSAIIGTAYTMFVTFLISFVLGISAAVWLEELAPKGRFSDLIEVNINNLAAVPSIVKGILGLLLFQLLLGFPRGTPILGGIVLSLVAMPTIIVASRAAIKSVPSSLKQAALGVGASNMQAVFQHVVPAALPGMLTGTIIGLAQALGETAPLLMIGMKAYVPVPPSGLDGFMEPATTMAATIYNWFSLGKDSFNELASAAILVLLFFLLCMNALAVYLRKKFELDW